MDWTSVGAATSFRKENLNMTVATTYYGSVRAIGQDAVKSATTNGDGWLVSACPTGYVLVPGNSTPGLGGEVYSNGTKSNYDWSTEPAEAIERRSADFCVMKYEAKQAGSEWRAISTAANLPWGSIPRELDGTNNDAQEACNNNGPEYQLIGNHHWQAIARNIESVASNFDTSGAAVNYQFNQGFAEGSATVASAASEDANGCYDITTNGDPDDDCGGQWHINKRTHTLSNGVVLWDFVGNLWEWVRDNVTVVQGNNGIFATTITYNAGINGLYDPSLKWGPANNYGAQAGSRKAGLGSSTFSTALGAVIRGGSRVYTNAGLFHAQTNRTLSTQFSTLGFRCVYTP